METKSTLLAALEAPEEVEDEEFLYEKHVLDAELQRETAQAKARAEHQATSVENAFAREVVEATRRYERQRERLRQSMVDEIATELRLLKENRDGVSLNRKGLSRLARTCKSISIYDEGAAATSGDATPHTMSTSAQPILDSPSFTKTKIRVRHGALDAIVGPLSSADTLADIVLIQQLSTARRHAPPL
ncbi:Aste57867_1588 [Aphanomyces stellatus]|uniref:Aste57867_1588 protein n=1 Tax=Aphanomyces stellatus TaxID=120398 RepID=A0A485KAQ2_9STRA|nr:hypothetical protein As57867_001587 [Aphanomyces stellatus]VFT78801.1 Aste57867_1588 [Aphanomyces stellatus]